MIDYEYFLIEASSLDYVGTAFYDEKTRRLQEKGTISQNSTNTIEFLVYRAQDVPLSKKNYNLSIHLNNTVIRYHQKSGSSVEPMLIINNTTRRVQVEIPTLAVSQTTQSTIIDTVESSVSSIRAIATILFIASSVLLCNSLSVLAKMFQVIEFLLNLSFINSNLGQLMEKIIKVLRALKFPIRLPTGLFWPDYEKAADTLFWKWRFKITKYEKQLFILCNETLIVLLYIFFWIIWLVLACLNFNTKKKKMAEKNNSLRKKVVKITQQGMRASLRLRTFAQSRRRRTMNLKSRKQNQERKHRKGTAKDME